jgi:agmatine/peptidylarginine deiminase
MRDFSIANPIKPVMFRYTAAGQGGGKKGQTDADAVQEVLAEIAEEAGLSFVESNLLNDGGNVVDDYAGNVVVSKKFLRDNHISEEQARQKLRELTGANNVAFIEADEQGGLEHADGVVSFIDTNTLMINSYPQDPKYSLQLKADLQRGLPGVKILEIVTPYDGSKIFDQRFGSACGLYTNALVTPERIYFPQFGIPEDELALSQVKAATTREVVPVPSPRICQMGGGVRCMSWQIRGDNAEKLMSYINSQNNKE